MGAPVANRGQARNLLPRTRSGTRRPPNVYLGMLKAARFANVLLLSIGGAWPTMVVLAVLAVLGVPPYAGILTDLRGLFSLLIG
jgi:hypothetical protein